MSGYIASKTVPNLARKIDYIKNHDIMNKNNDYYDTANNDFWKLLAKENQLRQNDRKSKFYGKTQKRNEKNCVEARQLIIGIPQNINITAKELCDIFKDKYAVECCCAIHTKTDKQKNIVNKHAHLIFADRQKLKKPIIIDEVKTSRTYYYDKDGKKCKKTEAVKIVPKGTITTKGKTQYFTSKIRNFGDISFIEDVKNLFLNKVFNLDWSLQLDKEDNEFGLQTQHIGYKNTKSEFIKDNNELKLKFKSACELTYYHLQNEQENFKNLKEYKEYKLKEYNIKYLEKYNVYDFRTKRFNENREKLSNFIDTVQNEYNNFILTVRRNEVSISENIIKEVDDMNQANIYANSELARISLYDSDNRERLNNIVNIFDKIKEKFINLKHLLSFQKFFTSPEYCYNVKQNELGYTYFVRSNGGDTGVIQEQEQQKEDNNLER